MPKTRLIETTDKRLTQKILPRKRRCLVLFCDIRSHIGHAQKIQLVEFLTLTDSKALIIDVAYGQQDNPDRPVRLMRLPTLALFQDGQCIRKAEGLISAGQIGKKFF